MQDTFEIHSHEEWGFCLRRRRGTLLFNPSRPIALAMNGGEVICFANARSCADYMSCTESNIHAGVKGLSRVKGYKVRHATAEEAMKFFAPRDMRTDGEATSVQLNTPPKPKKTLAYIAATCKDILEAIELVHQLKNDPTDFKLQIVKDVEAKVQDKLKDLT